MPNPMTRVGPANTSHDVYPDSMGDIVEGATPTMETYAGDNQPYRGVETHGVEPDNEPRPTPGYNTRMVAVRTDPAPPNYEPIPVRVVEEGGREIRSARTVVMFAAGAGNAKLILGRDEDRTFTRFKNPEPEGGATIYIADQAHVVDSAAMNGFPILPGEHYETQTQTELYASCTGGTDKPIPMIIEYSLPIGPPRRAAW